MSPVFTLHAFANTHSTEGIQWPGARYRMIIVRTKSTQGDNQFVNNILSGAFSAEYPWVKMCIKPVEGFTYKALLDIASTLRTTPRGDVGDNNSSLS